MRTRFAAAILVAAVLAFPLPARAATTVQIAIFDFAGPEETWVGRGIALLIERELLARDGVVVLDRRHLGTVLAEAKLAASGVLTPGARRSLRVGAIDYAVVGTWKHGNKNEILISAMVLDTGSGATVAHAQLATTVRELSTAAARITSKLAGNLASRAPGIAAPPRFVLSPVPAEEVTSLTRAAEAEEKGDYVSAHLHIRKGLIGRPDSTVLRLALGRLLLRMGEPLHAALSLREAAAGGDPAVASDALSLLARVFEHDLGRFELAAAAYRELIRRFPHVGDVERSRIREIDLLDRAGRDADAYLRLMEHRDRLLTRIQNLDEKTRWFGYPYQRLAGEVKSLETMLAKRYVELPDAERSGLPRPRTVHLVEEDGLEIKLDTLVVADPLYDPNRTRHLIAPEGRSILSVTIAADTGPDQGIPPASIPESQIGVRVAAGYQVLRFGTGNAPRGVEAKTLVFDEPARVQSFVVDTSHRWRRLHGMRLRIRLGPAAEETARAPWPKPDGTKRIVEGVAGAVSWLDAVADGADLAIVFCDVATFLGPGSGGYPWPIGKDADLYLARRTADGETSVERLPLSSEQEDIYPTLARGPGGLWRLFWLSNRRTGFVFEPFTATSEDLRHWTWPRPVDLGFHAEPGFARNLMWANLGATVPLSAPRLFGAPDGRWWLFGYANYGPGDHGTYLFSSDDGERFTDPVLLSKGRPGIPTLTANRRGGVEAVWIERTGEHEPYSTEFVHTLRRFRVVGGRVATEMQISLGDALAQNSQSTVLRPWVGPTGEVYAGWTRRAEPGPDESPHSFRPLLLRLFKVNDEGDAELLTSDTPIFGGQFTLATPEGIHMLRPWSRWHISRAVEGGIDHWLADLPGREVAAAPREPIVLPASERDSDAPLTAVVLPFVAQGSKDDAALGEAATALLLEAIAGGPQLRLVTRDRLGAILAEVSQLGASGRLRVGSLAGADLVYSGTIAVNGKESTVVIRELSVETTKVRVQRTWIGRTEILLPMLASLAAETGNAWHDIETGVERFAEDAEARMHFVSSVSDVLSGITHRAAGGFFEALRLGLDFPPTRYWLARSLEDLGERAGAETEYMKYLAESPSGIFAEDARLGVHRVGNSMPEDSAWVPRVQPAGEDGDLLRRIYRGRSMDERVAALRSYVAGPGRDRLDTLLEVFDLESDEWFRFQVLSALRDLDPRIMLRAAAREVRSGSSLENELGNFFRGMDTRPWFRGYLLECLAPEQTPETEELWEGLNLLPGWPLGRGPLTGDLAEAVVSALGSDDLVRVDRALKVLATSPCDGTFDRIARVFDDADHPDETRGMAASALQASDPIEAWRHFEPRLIEGLDAELLKNRVYFIPVPIEAARLKSLLLDEASEGWYGLLLQKAKQTIADELGALTLEMMRSDSDLVRRRGLYLIEKEHLTGVPGIRAALLKISVADPDPELRDLALNRRCWLATEEDAPALLEDIAGLSPEWRQRNTLGSLSHALLFRPAPEPADGIEGWRAWLEFFKAERAKTGPMIAELRSRSEPSGERALVILEALSDCRDPEAVHAIAEWLGRYRRTAEAEPSAVVKRAARDAVNRILTALGFPEHLLPGDGVQLQTWVMDNDPGTFRPWRR